MILQQNILFTAGVSTPPFVNAGSVSNKGLEFSALYRDNIDEFKYNVTTNFTFNKNNLEKLYNTEFINGKENIRGVLLPIRNEVGYSLNSFYGYETEGLFQTQEEINAYKNNKGELLQPNARPGDLKFSDINGNGVIDSDDRKILGNPFPSISFNFQFGFDYKGFDLNLFFQGVTDVSIMNALKFTGYNANVQNYNRLAQIKNAWTPTNTNTTIPRLSKTDPNGNFTNVSDFYIEDGSYIRLKNITLGYTMPE